MGDKYDKQIARLTKHPELMYGEWFMGKGLFQFCTRNGAANTSGEYGCLTMVRDGLYRAETPELTERITTDKRIPKSIHKVKPAHLPVFAEYQREMDRTIRKAK